MLKDLELYNYVTFLGVKSNPYPFIYGADMIVHPSQFEGKSIALDEAKLLCKPIVVTDYSTVLDQFTDNYNGVICTMDEDSLYTSIIKVFENKDLAQTLVRNLNKDMKSNVDEINKLYSILG